MKNDYGTIIALCVEMLDFRSNSLQSAQFKGFNNFYTNS